LKTFFQHMYGKVLVDEACRVSDQNLVKILFSNLRIQLGCKGFIRIASHIR